MEICKYEGNDFTCNVSFDDGMFINATEIYQAAGKTQTAFVNFKNRVLIPRAQKLIEMGAIAKSQNVMSDVERPVTVDDLIIVRKGGPNGGGGTWIHPKLRMVFTRWISEPFDIFCDMKIEELFTKGYTGLTKEITTEIDQYSSKLTTVKKVLKKLTIKPNTHIAEQLMDIIKIAVETDIPIAKLLNDLSASTTKDTRDILYKRMLNCLENALECKVITHGQYIDLKEQVKTNRQNLLSRKLKQKEKEVANLEQEVLQLTARIGESSTPEELVKLQAEVDRLHEENKKLARKLANFEAEENSAPVDMSFLSPITNVSDAIKILDAIDKHPSCSLVFNGILFPHKHAGKKTTDDKATYPDMVGNYSPNYSAAYWKSSRFLKITKGNENNKYSFICQAKLERSANIPTLYLGFVKGQFNKSFYIAYEEATDTLIVYSV